MFILFVNFAFFPVFDDSGNFLIFASMVGIKGMSILRYLIMHHSVYHSDPLTTVINLYTNKCVRIIGKVTNYWCVCVMHNCVSATCTCTVYIQSMIIHMKLTGTCT